MKKYLILPLLAFAFSANAQLFNFGVKGGVNFPNLKISKNSSISDINTADGFGYHIGAMLRINVPFVYVQPEVLYTKTASDFSFMSNGTQTSSTYDMQRIDIPVMVGLKLGPAAIFGGPIASFNVSSPNDIFNNGYESSTWGYQVGVGLKLWRILGEIKYEGPFGDATTSAQIAGNSIPLDSRTSMLIVSVGYFFRDKK
jgi:hypothetical protein